MNTFANSYSFPYDVNAVQGSGWNSRHRYSSAHQETAFTTTSPLHAMSSGYGDASQVCVNEDVDMDEDTLNYAATYETGGVPNTAYHNTHNFHSASTSSYHANYSSSASEWAIHHTSIHSSYPSSSSSKPLRVMIKKNSRVDPFSNLEDFVNGGDSSSRTRHGYDARHHGKPTRASSSRSPYNKHDRSLRKRKGAASRTIESDTKLAELRLKRWLLQQEWRTAHQQAQQSEDEDIDEPASERRRGAPLKIRCPGGRSLGYLTLKLGNNTLEASSEEGSTSGHDEMKRMPTYPGSDGYDSSGEGSNAYERSVFRVGRA